jgi:hypothetical protein
MSTKAIIALVLIGTYYIYKTSRPKWLDDLLIRTYAADHLADGRKDPIAASIASEHGLPMTWVMELRTEGVSDSTLSARAGAVIDRIVALGPPSDTNKDTLIAYKAKVLDVTP